MDKREIEKVFPPWDQLDEETRKNKMSTVNEDLRVMDIAGYAVWTKPSAAPPPVKTTARKPRSKAS